MSDDSFYCANNMHFGVCAVVAASGLQLVKEFLKFLRKSKAMLACSTQTGLLESLYASLLP